MAPIQGKRFDGGELRRRRRAAGISRASLALAAGVSSRSIGFYETGQASPRDGHVQLMAAAVHCPPGDLLIGVDEAGRDEVGATKPRLRHLQPKDTGPNHESGDRHSHEGRWRHEQHTPRR